MAGAVVVALLPGTACRPAPQPPARPARASWLDSSRHTATFVTIATGVRLEVLDWGGSGPPLVFLAGLEDVAHCFDDFAPQFTDHFHVFALTRRGYGASSRPDSGYDLATRVEDLHDVLDALHLERVILAGHSIAGDELTGFARRYPDRVDRLVYFDAAYDHSALDSLLAGWPAPPPPGAADSASPLAFQAYLERTWGTRIPEAQIRATKVFDDSSRLIGDVTPSRIDSLVIRGAGHPDYAAVHAPALAFYAVLDSAPQVFAYWSALSDSVRAQARPFGTRLLKWEQAERDAFRKAVPHARVVELKGANHYLFFSNAAEVVPEMRSFLEAPPPR